MRESILPEMPAPIFLVDTQREFDRGVIYDGSGHRSRHPVAQFLDLYPKASQYREHVIRPHEQATYETALSQCVDFFRVLDGAGISGTVVIDEADLFSSASGTVEPIRNMVFRGRHYAQHLIFTAKRTTTISKNVLSASHCVISFQQRMGADVKRLDQMYSVGAKVQDLGTHEFVVAGDRVEEMPFHETLSSEPEHVNR